MSIKSKNEKEQREKTIIETNNRLSSLQQIYKLLQSEDEDLKEDCAKTKAKHLDEINGLERKIKSLQGQLVQSESERNKEIEHWKVNCFFFCLFREKVKVFFLFIFISK